MDMFLKNHNQGKVMLINAAQAKASFIILQQNH